MAAHRNTSGALQREALLSVAASSEGYDSHARLNGGFWFVLGIGDAPQIVEHRGHVIGAKLRAIDGALEVSPIAECLSRGPGNIAFEPAAELHVEVGLLHEIERLVKVRPEVASPAEDA